MNRKIKSRNSLFFSQKFATMTAHCTLQLHIIYFTAVEDFEDIFPIPKNWQGYQVCVTKPAQSTIH